MISINIVLDCVYIGVKIEFPSFCLATGPLAVTAFAMPRLFARGARHAVERSCFTPKEPRLVVNSPQNQTQGEMT